MEEYLDQQHQQQQKGNNGQLQRLEGIEEEGGPAEKWPPPTTVRAPETSTETMEFLARSWSLSATELSKALKVLSSKGVCDVPASVPVAAASNEEYRSSLDATLAAAPQAGDGGPGNGTGGAASPPFSPRADAQLLRAAAVRRAGGKTTTMGAWIKEQKEEAHRGPVPQRAGLRGDVRGRGRGGGGRAGRRRGVLLRASSSFCGRARPQEQERRSERGEDGGGHRVGYGAGGVALRGDGAGDGREPRADPGVHPLGRKHAGERRHHGADRRRGHGAARGRHAACEAPQGDPGHRSAARGHRRQGGRPLSERGVARRRRWGRGSRSRRKKRAEARSRNAQAYAATSVAGVAAAVAALVASAVFSSAPPPPSAAERGPKNRNGVASGAKTAEAIASATALVASHCVEMAQAMGASHEQILGSIHSAVNTQASGDIMALTAGVATALRGAAMLRARLHKEIQATALPPGDTAGREGGP